MPLQARPIHAVWYEGLDGTSFCLAVELAYVCDLAKGAARKLGERPARVEYEVEVLALLLKRIAVIFK